MKNLMKTIIKIIVTIYATIMTIVAIIGGGLVLSMVDDPDYWISQLKILKNNKK